ncbi:842_t:CDS:2, partial [Paraglomus brasilianum]
MEVLETASIKNSKNMVQQVLELHTDFSEALSNTTRETINPALKRKLYNEETVVDVDSNPFFASEHEKGLNNAITTRTRRSLLTACEKSTKDVNNQISRDDGEKSSLALSCFNMESEDVEEIKCDFTSIEEDLLRQPSNEDDIYIKILALYSAVSTSITFDNCLKLALPLPCPYFHRSGMA